MIIKALFSGRVRKCIAWACFIGGLIGWPLTALTIARSEPQFILGLSWFAIILEGFNSVGIHDDDIGDGE